jgi:hypothetical protein
MKLATLNTRIFHRAIALVSSSRNRVSLLTRGNENLSTLGRTESLFPLLSSV